MVLRARAAGRRHAARARAEAATRLARIGFDHVLGLPPRRGVLLLSHERRRGPGQPAHAVSSRTRRSAPARRSPSSTSATPASSSRARWPGAVHVPLAELAQPGRTRSTARPPGRRLLRGRLAQQGRRERPAQQGIRRRVGRARRLHQVGRRARRHVVVLTWRRQQSQLSILTRRGAERPVPVSSNDFRLIRKTAHFVLQWCMNSTGSFQPSCRTARSCSRPPGPGRSGPSCRSTPRVRPRPPTATRSPGSTSSTSMSKPPGSAKRNSSSPPAPPSPDVSRSTSRPAAPAREGCEDLVRWSRRRPVQDVHHLVHRSSRPCC